MTAGFATARVDVELAALQHNYRALQRRSAECRGCAGRKGRCSMVWGARRSRVPLSSTAAKTFFVARLEEGIDLRRWLGAGPVIYVFDGLTAEISTLFGQ